MNEQALNACAAELLESQTPLGFSTEAWERTLVPDVVVSLLFGALAFIETDEGRPSIADAKRNSAPSARNRRPAIQEHPGVGLALRCDG